MIARNPAATAVALRVAPPVLAGAPQPGHAGAFVTIAALAVAAGAVGRAVKQAMNAGTPRLCVSAAAADPTAVSLMGITKPGKTPTAVAEVVIITALARRGRIAIIARRIAERARPLPA